jgi:hypothetical protein
MRHLILVIAFAIAAPAAGLLSPSRAFAGCSYSSEWTPGAPNGFPEPDAIAHIIRGSGYTGDGHYVIHDVLFCRGDSLESHRFHHFVTGPKKGRWVPVW